MVSKDVAIFSDVETLGLGKLYSVTLKRMEYYIQESQIVGET